MKLIGALCLGLCGLLSAAHLQTWRSDQALWGWAAHQYPQMARPALNYGMALIRTDQEAGVIWLLRSVDLAIGHPRESEIRAIVRHRLMWLDAFGANVCSRPTVQPHC